VSAYRKALDASGRGWPGFLIAPGGKTPAIASAHPLGDPLRGVCRGECGKDGHGLYDATTDLDRIREWFASMPKANWAYRTGCAVDVLDVDVKGEDGLSTLAGLLDRHGCLPAGPSVSTPSGGLHYYFAPTGLGNAAGFAPGLDWRGAGGYVLAPPSKVDGRLYEWGMEPSTPLHPPPEWLVALVKPVRTPSQPQGGAIRRSSSAYARRALETEVGRLAMATVGDRNHQLNRSAFALGQLVAAGALDAREVVEALAVAAERIGLTAAEIEKTISSGLNRGMSQPRRLPA